MSGMLNQLVMELKSDRRKLGFVLALLAVGLLLWGRLLLKNVPQTATAAPGITAVAEASDSEEAVEEKAAPREKSVVFLDLPPDLPRDLFQANSRNNLTQVAPSPTKSRTGPADKPDWSPTSARAEDLRLEAVLISQWSGAVINGSVLGIGDQIEGFQLIGVATRQAVLTHDGDRVRLGM